MGPIRPRSRLVSDRVLSFPPLSIRVRTPHRSSRPCDHQELQSINVGYGAGVYRAATINQQPASLDSSKLRPFRGLKCSRPFSEQPVWTVVVGERAPKLAQIVIGEEDGGAPSILLMRAREASSRPFPQLRARDLLFQQTLPATDMPP